MRQTRSWVKWLYVGFMATGLLFAVAYTFYPYYVIVVAQSNIQYFAFLFAILMPFVFILFPATRKEVPQKAIPWYDFLLALLAFGSLVWVGLNGLEGQLKGWSMSPPLQVSIIGIIVWGLSIEAARRCGGTVFATVILIFSLLPYYGYLLPAPFTVHQHPLLRIPAIYLLDEQAIFGPAVKVLCRILIGYLMFGSVLQFVGGGQYLIKVALIGVGGIRGATGKVAIVTSAIFGMFSGSGISNVITTGTITIPAMKKSGYPPHYAGAIETCASIGGSIMPPVMAATAFIMAEITGIPYVEIAIAGFIPAFLYFVSIFIQSDFQAIKLGIKPIPKEKRTKLTFKLLLEGLDYFAAAAILTYVIFAEHLISWAPFYALIPLLIGGVVKKKITLKNAPDLITTIGGLLVTMSGLFACLGLVTGGALFTGFGLNVSNMMFRIGAENILLLVLLGGLVPLVMGMGVTTTAVYIIVAITLCPALVHLGLNLLAVHLFVLYYAALAGITPPVGVTYLAAARLAGAPPFKTGFQALRLGIVMMLIPLYFVHEPALILQGTPLETVISLATAFFAILLLSGGFERHMYGVGKITIPEVAAALISGFLIILPLASEVVRLGWILGGALVVYWIIKFLVTKARVSRL